MGRIGGGSRRSGDGEREEGHGNRTARCCDCHHYYFPTLYYLGRQSGHHTASDFVRKAMIPQSICLRMYDIYGLDSTSSSTPMLHVLMTRQLIFTQKVQTTSHLSHQPGKDLHGSSLLASISGSRQEMSSSSPPPISSFDASLVRQYLIGPQWPELTILYISQFYLHVRPDGAPWSDVRPRCRQCGSCRQFVPTSVQRYGYGNRLECDTLVWETSFPIYNGIEMCV